MCAEVAEGAIDPPRFVGTAYLHVIQSTMALMGRYESGSTCTYRWLVQNAMNSRSMATLWGLESLNMVALNYCSTISTIPLHFWQLLAEKYWWPTKMWFVLQANWPRCVYPCLRLCVQFLFSSRFWKSKNALNWFKKRIVTEFQSHTQSYHHARHSNGMATYKTDLTNRWQCWTEIRYGHEWGPIFQYMCCDETEF